MPAALCLTHAPFLRRPVEPRTTRLGAYSILLTAPWVLGKDIAAHGPRLAAVLYNLLETVRVCTVLLTPFMPESCGKIFGQTGADEAARTWDSAAQWGVLPAGVEVHKGENLFPRIDMAKELEELDRIQEEAKKAALPAIGIEPQTEEKVDFDTFCKSDFRAVKVKDCQRVKKSDKLLKFTLDDGTGTDRQILSGIAMYYKPEELVGRKIIVVANLKPARFVGVTSQGMLLAGTNNACGCQVVFVDDSVPEGTRIC